MVTSINFTNPAHLTDDETPRQTRSGSTGGLLHLSKFGLTHNPFAVSPDPRFFMQSQTHLDALASLIYGIRERKGFITLTGQVGTGKTTLLNVLLGNLDIDVTFSHIIYSDLSFFELLQMICTDFGMRIGRQTKVELMNELFDFLVENRLKGRNALVVIDEAQNLSTGVLESLRMLSNFETSREKLVQILLCGQPELKQNLSKPDIRQLAQRIVVNSELRHLNIRESVRYIYHRLSLAGRKDNDLIPENIAEQIASKAQGTPRIINIICDNCLLLAFAEGKKYVDEEILAQAEGNYFSVYDSSLTTANDNDIDLNIEPDQPEKLTDIRYYLKKKREVGESRFSQKSEPEVKTRKKRLFSGFKVFLMCLLFILSMLAVAFTKYHDDAGDAKSMDSVTGRNISTENRHSNEAVIPK